MACGMCIVPRTVMAASAPVKPHGDTARRPGKPAFVFVRPFNIRFRRMGRKNGRLACLPEQDRPFYILQKSAGTAGRGAAALRPKPRPAPLSGTAAIRNVLQAAPQKLYRKDNNPCTSVRPFAVRFRRKGSKIRMLAGFPDLEGARATFCRKCAGTAVLRRFGPHPAAAARDRPAGGSATGIGRERRPRGAPGTVRALTGTDIGERVGMSRKKIK